MNTPVSCLKPGATVTAMLEEIDIATWSRRDAFLHFRDFAQPFFSVCIRCDVAPLKAALARRPGGGRLSLALHHLALRLANEQAPFRLRLQGRGDAARVMAHERIDASTTVLRADESFGFAYLPWRPGYADFVQHSAAALDAAQHRAPGLSDPAQTDLGAAALMFFTTLPWVHFSSFAHARPGHGLPDSTPRVAFGRIDVDGAGPQARHWLPVALDVHHALMDGLHAGRWLQAFEAGLAAPDEWLAS